ncbi:alanine racemase, partial [filamentous cyanobacterium CCP5]
MLDWDQTPGLAPMRCCRAWVEIDLCALRHNVKELKRRLTDTTQLMAVVKADAYGHGAIAIAKTALEAGATWLGVATVPEGIELRQAQIQAPILVMGAVHSPEEVAAIAHWQLQPVLVTPKQALVFSETLSRLHLARPLSVHLQLDTGMSRLGFPWQGALEFTQFVKRLPHLDLASIYSHFATADSFDQTIMRQQHQRFEAALTSLKAADLLPPIQHLANSAAALTDSALHYHLVRVGLGIYGLHPAPHLSHRISLRPVMQVKARITHVKSVPAGAGISYGHQFVASRPMTIAVAGIGYADGVPRTLSNRMTVLVREQRVPQVGTITMDQLMLDVTAVPDLQEGEVVTLIGREGDS